MTDQEKISQAINANVFVGDLNDLCKLLVNEIKNLRLELEKVSSYDYRAYAPNVWVKERE